MTIMHSLLWAAIATWHGATAQPSWPPATEPNLATLRALTMSGEGFYVEGSTVLPAAYYQDDASSALRIDMGPLNTTAVAVEHVLFTGSGKQCTQFVNHGTKIATCMRGVPNDWEQSFSYSKQLLAFGKAQTQYMGLYNFSLTAAGSTSRRVQAFAGKLFEGPRGDVSSIVMMNAGEGGLYSGQMDLFSNRVSLTWLEKQSSQKPSASLFAVPAGCPGSTKQPFPRPREMAPSIGDRNVPTLTLDKSMTGTGTYTDVRSQNKDVVSWYQDAANQRVLISIGDTSTEKWQQVNLYNATGRYLMVLEQGIPKCFFTPALNYANWSATWPSFSFAGTATIDEYPAYGALNLFGGFSGMVSLVPK